MMVGTTFNRWIVGALCLLVSTVDVCAAEQASGLPVGSTPVPFDVKDCTGPAAGKTLCYFCRYGRRPVIAIFTRELNDPVQRLIAMAEQSVKENRESRLAAFVVYLGEDTRENEQQLKELALLQKLQHTPLTILKESAQRLDAKYKISSDAKVTVMTWRDLYVQRSVGFDSAELSEDDLKTLAETIRSVSE